VSRGLGGFRCNLAPRPRIDYNRRNLHERDVKVNFDKALIGDEFYVWV
jgi:hypothetical protein